ncbi:hypothetical protein PUN28_011198 [Cardiocondyla obscurior]|uniref:Uncharacterized protein n=1 Tax=Cardiocondyla obscurior TaxID=286306 RepID=A0AAW2FM78_9HYME
MEILINNFFVHAETRHVNETRASRSRIALFFYGELPIFNVNLDSFKPLHVAPSLFSSRYERRRGNDPPDFCRGLRKSSAKNIGRAGKKEYKRVAITVEAVFRAHCSSSGRGAHIESDRRRALWLTLYVSRSLFAFIHLAPARFSREETLRSVNGALSLRRCDLPLNFDIYPLVAAARCND